MLAELVDHVIGVDPDRDRITAAVVCATTHSHLAAATFPTTPGGYRAAIRWADEHTGTSARAWSIEGAGSYGAGLASTLMKAGELVIEFDHPTTRSAKDGAKSDPLDAVRAAREVLSRRSWSTPRARGAREGLRTLIVARDSAKTARTAAINALRALMITAPVDLREELRRLTLTALVTRCRRLRHDATSDTELAAVKMALRSVATRIDHLTVETRELETAMRRLVEQLCPALLNQPGVGTLLAAQIIVSWSHPGRCRSESAFARLAGIAPLEANSGQTQTRHRLNRGGDRQLNRAIHQAAVIRAKSHPETRAYLQRRITEGKTKREALRCVKRYLTRRLFRILESTPMPA
jgi:transposase